MFKNIFAFLFLTLCSVTLIFAQDNGNLNFQFEETETVEVKPPYFGLGGGYIGAFVFPKFDEVQKRFFGFDELKGGIYLSGAEGFSAIAIIPNVRLGFFGFNGSKSYEKAQNDTTMGVSYAIGFTGFSIDYGYVPFKSLALLGGANIGWSNITIEKYKSTSNLDWNSLPNEPTVYFWSVEGKFWFIEPKINVEYAITPFFMIRAGIGYSFAFSKKWKYNRVSTLDNVPTSLNTNGLKIQFGLFLGLFNY